MESSLTRDSETSSEVGSDDLPFRASFVKTEMGEKGMFEPKF